MIETANVSLDEVYCRQDLEAVPGDYVALFVSDTGTGMPPEVVRRVFEPFFTTKETGRGSGLGLSMVYGFTKQSRGHVKVYSEVGHGTCIKLYLPRASGVPTISVSSAPALVEYAAAGRETILVAEDDAAVRAVAVGTLESLGYRVHEAANGRDALDLLRQGEAVDLLFTDLVMPNGMSGQELLRLARECRPSLKAIFTSGYSETFLKGREKTDHSVPLLSKPYRKQQLLELIRKVLDGR